MTDDGLPARRDGICVFFELAWGITWALDLPLARGMGHEHLAAEHLDNVSRAPETEVRLRILRVVVLAIVAAFAARSLTRKKNVAGVALTS